MRRRIGVVAVLVVLALGTAGCGGSDSEEASRTVEVTMADGAPFQPSELSFEQGTTVRFVFHNRGKETHEAVFGDEHAQDEHEHTMVDQPHMEMQKTEDFAEIHAGHTDELTYTFDNKGTIIIGCHGQPGHYAKGEKLTVTVT